MILWAIIILVAIGLVVFAVRSRKPKPPPDTRFPYSHLRVLGVEELKPYKPKSKMPGGLRWASSDELNPETRKALDEGVMSNDQMAEVLRASGWNAKIDANGKLIVPDEEKKES